MIKFNLPIFMLLLISCAATTENDGNTNDTESEIITAEDSIVVEELPLFCNETLKVGAENTAAYFDQLKDVRVAVVGNQSSMIGDVHLVDSLLSAGIDVVKVFSPEHGFRGKADAGEKVNNEIDEKTNLPIVSLYGNNKKPKADQLTDVDVLLFDIQDVGVRFYTYISTLHYVMEAAAENDKKLIVLDRPNPNGHYVDGPVLKSGFTSFVGMHEVPVVHGMTIAEYALMVNGEGWLQGSVKCDLEYVLCENYDHTQFYELPIAPSPNLPNMASVYLYPSLCFFEGTEVSIGRGTDFPFQVIGHPDYQFDSAQVNFSFTPQPNDGAKHPKLEGKVCNGVDLHEIDVREYRGKSALDLTDLIDFYENLEMGETYFLKNNFIDLLAGTDELRKAILAGDDFETIQAAWQLDLATFKEMRNKYLLYVDFE